ncbi:hypothetical protein AB0B66_39660 [Catellatospora sp. NPDC049111]|uniref:hypothetical protein n=1 Tax=Catellatospora sp. NPDC049111 TaxID=3155271 RepID=UPI0033C8E944
MGGVGAPPVGRPLRDLGRFAVELLAGPIAAYLNRGRPVERHTTAREVRSDARARPQTRDDALVSCVLRFMAWLAICGVSLPAYILAATLRPLAPSLSVIMVVTIVSGMFSSSSAFFQIGRLTLLWMISMRGFPPDTYGRRKPRGEMERKHHQIFLRQGARSNRFVRWLCSPSHLDAGFAVLWTLMFAPLLIGDIPS